MELEAHGNGADAQAISRGMVALYKEQLGRGPLKAHTTIRSDLVVTLLSDSLTKAERTLVESGRVEEVRGLRRILQQAMYADMAKLVEEILQREVVCLLSDHSPDPDHAVEVLLLAPER